MKGCSRTNFLYMRVSEAWQEEPIDQQHTADLGQPRARIVRKHPGATLDATRFESQFYCFSYTAELLT